MAGDSWWRFYNTATDHPKVLLLTDAQFRAWVTLNSLASKMGGDIPDDMALIAMTLRKTVGKARDIVQVLLSAVLLDKTETGYRPHNWNEKQFKSDVSTDRVKRFRDKKRNVSETPHRQSTESETETENKLLPRALRAEFDGSFWPICPRKVGKDKAFKAFSKARKTTELAVLVEGMRRYALSRDGQEEQYTAHPSTWLAAGRWADEAASGSPAANGQSTLPFNLAEIQAQEEALQRQNREEDHVH